MSSADEIIPVRPAHRFDEEALARYLADRLEGFAGDLAVGQFGHGQSNPTFLLSSGGREWVLRKKPPGKLLPSAHAVDREYRIIKALQETDVPVPVACLLCEDDSVIGTPFYVMKRAEGRIFRDPAMPDVSSARERRAIADEMNRNLAKLHQVDWKALGLEGFGRPGNYMSRQVDRWTRQYEASKTDEIESMESLIQWLTKNIPDDETTTIVHGDYRLENMVIHPTEPRVAVLLGHRVDAPYPVMEPLVVHVLARGVVVPEQGFYDREHADELNVAIEYSTYNFPTGKPTVHQ